MSNTDPTKKKRKKTGLNSGVREGSAILASYKLNSPYDNMNGNEFIVYSVWPYTFYKTLNNGTSRKTELKNFYFIYQPPYFIYQPPDLIEQRGKTALININQIQVSICVIIPNKLCVSASEAHLLICP